MAIAVTTRSYDNARSGANTQESVLTAGNVAAHGVRRLFSLQLPGDKRGAEAQPLVVPGVKLDDGTTHDVIYVATMADRVFAFDAADGKELWNQTLGTPIQGTQKIDSHNINDHWGILSTPVIDQASGTMYLVAWVSQDGSVQHAQHFLHAISIRDGHPVHPPLNLEGAVFNPGHGLAQVKFQSAGRKQRASLLLTKVGGTTTVFVGFGSLQETSSSSQGWVIACNAAPFELAAAWASTVRFHGAGIWQAGAGLAADADGSIYLMTGNGGFDAVTDWGESFVKLKYAPRAGATNASLIVVDWWTPWSDDSRTGLDPDALEDAEPQPTNFRAYVTMAGQAARKNPAWADLDLGSGGPVVIPSLGAVVGAGKDGILYVLNQHNMGKTQPGDFDQPAGNYAKLKSPPVFFTYFPPTLNPAPNDIATLNTLFAGRTHHLHGNPLFWDSPDLGPVLYCWGENENLRAWSVANNGKVTFLASSAEQASAQAPVPAGGMPGGMLTLSSDGHAPHTGVVWATIPYFDANTTVSPGRLIAYDATQFGTFANGAKQIRKIWDSQDWNLTFMFNKFNVPVVANGRVIVPTYEGRVDVYGP
jgi:outer membrane protein assembly factor BamB